MEEELPFSSLEHDGTARPAFGVEPQVVAAFPSLGLLAEMMSTVVERRSTSTTLTSEAIKSMVRKCVDSYFGGSCGSTSLVNGGDESRVPHRLGGTAGEG